MRKQAICKQCNEPFTFATSIHGDNLTFCGACNAEEYQYGL